MNIYDKLNELTRSIKESGEYLRYKAAAEKVDANELHRGMLKDFITIQMQVSAAQMVGQEPSQEMISRFNTIYTTIANISDISDFLSAQSAFSIIMEDVSKEINKAASLDVQFLKIIPDIANLGESMNSGS